MSSSWSMAALDLGIQMISKLVAASFEQTFK
jgi:hypothetical protein